MITVRETGHIAICLNLVFDGLSLGWDCSYFGIFPAFRYLTKIHNLSLKNCARTVKHIRRIYIKDFGLRD